MNQAPLSSHWSWVEKHPWISAVALVAIPLPIAAAAKHFFPADTELMKVAYAGAATLFYGGLLGGALKIVLDEAAATKRRRDDAAGFVTNILRDLKAVHDRTETARVLIGAHRSAKTYGDELRGLIGARVELRNIERALQGRADGVDERARAGVKACVVRMRAYIGSLLDEFRREYKRLSDQQRGYEALAEAIVKEFAATRAGDPPKLPGYVWEAIERLPHLRAFIDSADGYRKGFEAPLDEASALLREELAQILGRRGPSRPSNAPAVTSESANPAAT